ncbi:MAG: hypothetical protein AAFZ65_04885 [Planctomycetota bacterium]
MLHVALLLTTAFGTAQDGAWTRLETPGPREVRQRVSEGRGSELGIVDGVVARRRQGQQTELRASEAALGVPDSARALVADAAGLTFVVSDEGLLVTSLQVEVLHPVEPGDGAPSGSPTGAAVDAQRRLWVTTREAFGVMDPSHYFGRTLEVPAPPPYRLRRLEPGALVVDTSQGTWKYTVDAGARPEPPAVLLDGRPLEPGARIEIDYGQSIPLEARGADGETFRWTIDRHHVWKALDGPVDDETRPGEHRLEVSAWDRDLRRSEPVAFELTVDFPVYYQTWFVGAAGAVAVGLLGLAFWIGYRRLESTAKRAQRAGLSTVLTLVFALQLLAAIFPHSRGWPFMGYSMYTEAADVGHMSYNAGLAGITTQGKLREIPLLSLGYAMDDRFQLLGPIIREGSSIAQQAADKHNAQHPDWPPLVRIQARARRSVVTAAGPVEVAPLILADCPVQPPVQPPAEGAGQ